MKAAFACWQDRLAPVFDTARQVRLVEAVSGRVVGETEVALAAELPLRKVLQLVEMDVGVLVCGAISRTVHEQVAAYGIEVIPFVTGELAAVVRAWLEGGLRGGAFAMPGCCRQRRRRCRERKVRRCRAEIAQDPSEEER